MITKCAKCGYPKAGSGDLCVVCQRLERVNPEKPPKYVAKWDMGNLLHRLDVPDGRDARRARWRSHRVSA